MKQSNQPEAAHARAVNLRTALNGLIDRFCCSLKTKSEFSRRCRRGAQYMSSFPCTFVTYQLIYAIFCQLNKHRLAAEMPVARLLPLAAISLLCRH